MYSLNKFSIGLLHPRYILTWIGILLLFCLVQMPYPWLVFLGDKLGRFSGLFLKRRVSIIKKNLEICFPDRNKIQIESMVASNLSSLGIALFETGIAWFWNDKRINEIFRVTGCDNFNDVYDRNNGVLIIGIHSMSLELGGRVMGLCFPVNAMYRPHNNKAMEYIQTRCRSRSGSGMIDRKNLKFMVSELKRGQAIWFAPDQDFGTKGTIFAPFFSVAKASTSKGVATIAKLSKSPILTATMVRNNESGKRPYELIIGKEITDFPRGDDSADAEKLNQIIETEIMHAPDQYLWAHRRFKTRPPGENSLYK
ncbi:LpxL/LpxP family Kdo(2)-lipid IV(A) lauroyl/palmitoleoyl acyltransferase [Morganella morganii]|uniref:LpxL/LpxP family Kdo(2)-lipid IV(A) lauroyl/palmitoleoyl acyltransferase n=1 Tax=Morganella morganii TaxID=582 RepID=UPI0029F39D45|nr:LpxL/LpxP family Kdo(2)-lipid IV(A) lauroyl/palmitoleoyl acyltransferase [Morganella morganii]HCT3118293.1 LpxL/LpxP family Kdo(2)-lipid IV(A) lauroyl/palmitoleoyl acyltransferase [Morganella morganii]